MFVKVCIFSGCSSSLSTVVSHALFVLLTARFDLRFCYIYISEAPLAVTDSVQNEEHTLSENLRSTPWFGLAYVKPKEPGCSEWSSLAIALILDF